MTRDRLLTLILFLISLIYGFVVASSKESIHNIESFLSLSNKKHLAIESFSLSATLSDRLFGRRIFSIRSFCVSVLFSALAFIVFLTIAVLTTPWLALYFNAVHFYARFHEITGVVGITSAIGIAIALFVEFLYVSKTRSIIREFLITNISSKRICLFFLVDIVTTVLLLILTIPIGIITALYCAQIYEPNIDISKSAIFITDYVSGTASELTLYNMKQFGFDAYNLDSYFDIAYSSVQLIYEQLHYRFVPYFLYNVEATDVKAGNCLLDVPRRNPYV